MRAALKQYGMRLVGPNGLGLVNLETGLALPFAQIGSRIHRGRISIIAQSGGVATHVLAWMTKEGLGLNKFLSLGNKLDVAENEVLEYLLEDPGTAAIYVYLEGMQDGRGLLGRQPLRPPSPSICIWPMWGRRRPPSPNRIPPP